MFGCDSAATAFASRSNRASASTSFASRSGDVAREPGVAGAVHFAHPARAERGLQLVGAESVSWSEAQGADPGGC
jgi:hypothetical protein